MNDLVDKKFIGIPYKLGGRSLDGADCIGVSIQWLRSQGINYEYNDSHGPVMEHWWHNNPRRFIDAFLQIGSIVKWQDLKKMDCALFLGHEQSMFPSCLGVMVDDRHFLTSDKDRGSYVQMLNLDWKNKFWGAIRLHKVVEKWR